MIHSKKPVAETQPQTEGEAPKGNLIGENGQNTPTGEDGGDLGGGMGTPSGDTSVSGAY